jgi:hypothetical protein
MVGVAWFVQIAHYRLFDRVGAECFARYAADNIRATAAMVVPPMLVEAGAAVVLAAAPPPGVQPGLAWAGLALVAVAWASTALVQWPRHRRFAREGFDAAGLRSLLATNLVRTAAWTVRGGLSLWMLARADLLRP